MVRTKRLSLAGLLLSSAAIAAPASAQERSTADAPEPPPQAQVVEEIIVTAQRREQSLQDVPLAVSAVTAETLESVFVNGVQDLSAVSPAVTFGQTTDPFNSSVRIRGIGTQVFSTAIEPSVSFVIDGVVLARQAQALTDLIDIERVEILRGPQSTLFGKNASAGVINIVTKAPSDTLGADAFGSYGSDNEVNLRGSVSGPISEALSFRLTAYSASVDGHVDNVFDGRDLNGSEAYGARAKLRWQATDDLVLTLAGDFRDAESDCCQFTLREIANPAFASVVRPVQAGPGNRQANVNALVFSDSEDRGGSLTAEWSLGQGKLTSITAYREFENDRNADIDSTPLAGAVPGVTLIDLNGGPIAFETFTQELRYNGRAFDRLDYVLGAYYYDFSLSNDFRRLAQACLAAGPAPGTCRRTLNLPLRFDTSLEETNVSAFFDVTADVTDQVQLFGGLRYAVNEQQVDYVRAADTVRGPDTDVFGPVRGEDDDTALTGRIGARFEATDDVSVYASYSRGFKTGAYDLTSGLTAAQFAEQPTEGEKADAFELGLRSQLFDRRVTANLTAFRTDFENFQAQAFDPVLATNRLVNAGSVRTQGLEFELAARPVSALTLNLAVAYTEATIREFVNGPCYASASLPPSCRVGPGGVRLQDLRGAEVPNSPDLKIQISGRYEIVTALPVDFFVAGNVATQSSVQFSLNQNPRTVQDGYTIANLNVGVQNKEGSVVLTGYVRNLFDEDYAGFIFETPAGDPLGISQIIPRDAERLFGASLRMSF